MQGLFAHGGGGDTWNGLALSNLNMNGFSITNINTVTIDQTDTTGQGLDVSRNLAAASTDSSIVCFYNLNAGDDQPVLTVRTASNAAAANPLVIFESTDAAFDEPVLQLIQAGTGNYFTAGSNYLSKAGTLKLKLHIFAGSGTSTAISGINFDGGASTAQNLFSLENNDGIAVNVDGDGQTKLTGIGTAGYTLWVYRNLAAGSTDSPLMRIEQANTGDSEGCLSISTASNATAANPMVLFTTTDAAYDQQILRIVHLGTNSALYVGSSANASISFSLVKFESTDAAFDQPILQLVQDGTVASLQFLQAQDVEVIDFDGCTDGGTTHTNLVESLKVQMPGGTTGYINFYATP